MENFEPSEQKQKDKSEEGESLIFTEQEMIDCFTAGVNFGRNMMSNPSNSEYLEIIKKIKRKSV